MKKPVILLFMIVLSMIVLSIIFPSDPKKVDLITKMRSSNNKPIENSEVVNNYRVVNLYKLLDSGNVLAWSFDEKELYYSVKVKNDNEIGLEELWITDLNGEKRKINTKIKLYNINNAKWSPDRKKISFISTYNEKNNLLIYDVQNQTIKDITPKQVSDVGITSYDWDDESLNVIMSVDILSPKIEVYNLKSGKIAKLDMNLKECRNVAYYTEGRIIFSDRIDDKYMIFSADRYGKDIVPITEGWSFIISPDRYKLAITSDSYGQEGLWVYYTALNEKKELALLPVSNIYWLQDSNRLLYSTEEDSKSMYTYKGTIYYYDKDMKKREINGAVYANFIPSASGSKIAMISPDIIKEDQDNIGIFIGDLYK